MGREELLTIVLLDVVGSMALWEANAGTAAAAIARLEAIVDECVERNGGVVHKSRGEGDSFFLTFSSAKAALQACADLDRRLMVERWPTESPIQIRAAVRTGDCYLRDGDYFGPTVNRCARMRAVASPAQTLVCDATAKLVGQKLSSGVALAELGRFTLRDSNESETLFGLVVDDAVAGRKAPILGESGGHNLPDRATTFIGRSAELDSIERALRDWRLVTLTGAGGAGKTRLAERVSKRFIGEKRDGVWFVSLVDCADVDQVAAQIARTLPNFRAADASWDSLAAWFATKQALIILDNCERLSLQLAPNIRRLVLAAPDVRFLATSRRAFGLAEEHSFVVPPFFIEPGTNDLDQLAQSEAIQLFLSRASGKDASLRLTEANASAIASICKRLDGMPLAIEHAASYAGRMTPQQIDRRLSQRLDFLRVAQGTAEARHETMQATIEWSVELLSADAKRLLSAVGRFVGGWTLEAAVEVIGGDFDAYAAHDELVDCSLVVWHDEPLTGRRYRLLEPTREFVVAQLPCELAVQERRIDWAVAFAQETDRELVGANQAEWIRRSEQELENFRSALNQLWTSQDTRAPEFVRTLRRVWLRLGLYREGALWIERALSLEASSEPELRATLLNALGAFHWRKGDIEASEKSFRQALDLWTGLQNRAQIAALNTNLAICLTETGPIDDALALYENSCAIYRQLGDESGLGSALMNKGFCLYLLRRLPEAKDALNEAKEILVKLGDQVNLSFTLGSLAFVQWIEGDRSAYQKSIASHFAALELAHDPPALFGTLAELTQHASESGRWDLVNASIGLIQELQVDGLTGLSKRALVIFEKAQNEALIKAQPISEMEPHRNWAEQIETARSIANRLTEV